MVVDIIIEKESKRGSTKNLVDLVAKAHGNKCFLNWPFNARSACVLDGLHAHCSGYASHSSPRIKRASRTIMFPGEPSALVLLQRHGALATATATAAKTSLFCKRRRDYSHSL